MTSELADDNDGNNELGEPLWWRGNAQLLCAVANSINARLTCASEAPIWL